MLVPQINIDHGLCRRPLECAICLNACPQAVFKAQPVNVYKFRETPEDEYRLKAVYRVDCSGCGRCARECPAGAITVEYQTAGKEEGKNG